MVVGVRRAATAPVGRIRANRPFLDRALTVAKAAAREVGRMLLSHFGRVDVSRVRAKARSDYVTDLDRKSERIIGRRILKAFPNHCVVGEESGEMKGPAVRGLRGEKIPYRWLVDPLDGTTNYIHGYPMWSVSIALVRTGAVFPTNFHPHPLPGVQLPSRGRGFRRPALEAGTLLGVVLDPLREELFWAARGRGCWMEKTGGKTIAEKGRRLRVNPPPRFQDALIATGFPFRIRHRLNEYWKTFRPVFLASGGVRRCGSACLDFAYLAAGRLDGFWEMGLNPWDIAAGEILVEEAGGVVTDFSGGETHLEKGDVVAGSPAIHRRLVRILASVL